MYANSVPSYPSPAAGSTAKMAFAVIGMLVAGTGSTYAVSNADSWWSLIQHRVSFSLDNNSGQKSSRLLKVDIRSSAEHIENIREILNPSMSDLANTFGVSRQAVYKWLGNESEPEIDTLAKIKRLSSIADSFSDANVQKPGNLLKMKAFDGLSLLDLVRSHRETPDHLAALIDEAQKMERNSAVAEVNSSKAKPTSDWQAYISISGSAERT